ncbi:MAG TPA: hypothetical protein VGK64_16265 [Bryobacteraceae bacterium]
MAIGRPALLQLALLHDRQSSRIGKRKTLILEFLDHCSRSLENILVKSFYSYWQLINEVQKLQPSLPVISPQEPTMSFRHH